MRPQQRNEVCGQTQHSVAVDLGGPEDVGAVREAFEGLAHRQDTHVEIHRVPGQSGDLRGAVPW